MPEKPTYDELLEVVRDAEDRLRDIRKMCWDAQSAGEPAPLLTIEARAFYGKQFRALNAAGVPPRPGPLLVIRRPVVPA